MKTQNSKFPWGPIIAWCAGLALPLSVMTWQQPTAMQATYLLMALSVFYGGGGLGGFLPAIGRRSGGEVRWYERYGRFYLGHVHHDAGISGAARIRYVDTSPGRTAAGKRGSGRRA